MRWRLIVAAVLLIPVVEIAVLVAVGQLIGIGWALLATLALSVLGATVIRREGRRSIRRLQQAAQTGQLPESGPGGLRLAGGVALLIPGLVTDLVGLLLLIPQVRGLVRRVLLRAFVTRVSPETAQQMFGPRRVRVRRGRPSPETDNVIEGEIVDPDHGQHPAE